MRWYCVHPSLPLQAELRIRAAPDSSAPERGRISQGRAIATRSPVFQARENDDDATPVSWLQMAYLDAASGETEEGFVMAALPDGMSLVTPWETTGYCGCCEVMDPSTLMFDGPQDAAQSLGAVQSVAFLYCMMEESETRVRIFHAELESVWIDKNDLQVVSTRLEHEECSTSHTFYEMNDELPEEAQIAVREYPSKEAQVVGLLSRDETLEVTMRSGNWLQIVGGSLDKAWIMFRTDALELLREAQDVCSSNCQRIQRDIDDIVHVESTANQAFCAESHTAFFSSDQVASNKTASIIVPEAGHEHNAALEVDDAQKMGDENAIVTVDDFPGTTVNVDNAEHTLAREDCPLRQAQLMVMDDNSACHSAALRSDVTDDWGDTFATGSAAGTTTTQVAEAAHAVEASNDRPVHSARLTQDEADAVDDFSDAAVGVHSNVPNVENEQRSYFWCERPIQPARAISNEAGEDSTIAGDDQNVTSCKKGDMKETENDESAQIISSQGDLTRPLRSSPDPNDAVAQAVTNTVPLKTKMIVTDINDSNGVEDIGADLSWDDRPIRPARKVLAEYSCSAGNFAVSETRGAVPEFASQSWDDSLRITAQVNDEIGDDGDATAVISANNVHDTAAEITESVQNVESWDNRPIRPAPLDCDDDDVINGNGAVNFVTVASYIDECANGKEFESWGDRLNRPAQPDEEGANGSTTAHVGERGYETRSNVEVLGPVHVNQPGYIRPAQTVFDRASGNDAGDTSAIVAELAVVDAVDSSKACVDFNAANFKTEAARPSHFVQPWGDRPVRSSSTIPNEADDESLNSGCDNLRFRPTHVVHDEVDCSDGTGALAVEKEAKSNVMEPSQPWDQRPIWPEQSWPDAPAGSGVTRKRIGTAVVDANIAGEPSANDDADEVVQVRPNNPVLKDCVTLGGTNNAAVSADLFVVVKNAGDNTIADETHFINVGRITMDVVEGAKRVQTAPSQDYPLALGGSAVLFSDASIETVQDRHNAQLMTRLSVFGRRYAESETTSGSENGEIALLGGLEDVFEPVDEWLSAMQDEDNEGYGDGSLAALPVAIRNETSRSHDRVMNEERGEQLDSSRSSHNACHSAEEKTQTEVAVQPVGISFLQVFGIRKYCEHKQTFITPADELSLAMYEANQDDSDLVFQALVGDSPLSDDWFYDVSSRHFQAYTHSSLKDLDLLNAGPRLTFELIMSDASPEDILAAELSDDDCGDFDLVISFKYPAPRRRVIGPSRPPPPFARVPSTPPAGIEIKTASATNGSGDETDGAPSASRQPSQPSRRTSTKTSQEPAIDAVTSSKTTLSKQCISQPKMDTPSSRLRRNSIMTPVAISKPPSSLVQPRSLMQPLHAPPVSYADSTPSGLAPPLNASASSTAEASTSILPPSTRSFFQRRSFVSTPSSSRALSGPHLARNSITGLPKPTEVSGLSAPRKSFGFRYPSGLTKKT